MRRDKNKKGNLGRPKWHTVYIVDTSVRVEANSHVAQARWAAPLMHRALITITPVER